MQDYYIFLRITLPKINLDFGKTNQQETQYLTKRPCNVLRFQRIFRTTHTFLKRRQKLNVDDQLRNRFLHHMWFHKKFKLCNILT